MRVGERRNAFWHGGPFVVLATAAQPSQRNPGPVIHHHPGSPGSRQEALIWSSIERYPVPQTQPRTTYRSRHILPKICFLAIVQCLNSYQRCSSTAVRMFPFICSYLSEDCFSMCVPLALKSPVLYALNMSCVFLQDKSIPPNFGVCKQFWQTALRFTQRSGPPALCLSSEERRIQCLCFRLEIWLGDY